MPVRISRPPITVLGSWKEIASYLGKGVRTVQRWEREFGLPVRRPNGGQRRIVHASPAELDQWLATRWEQRPGKYEYGALPNGGKSVKASVDIESARELRNAHRQLVAEVRQSLHELARSCQALAMRVAVSETLQQQPVFPHLDHQRGRGARPVDEDSRRLENDKLI